LLGRSTSISTVRGHGDPVAAFDLLSNVSICLRERQA
jgi:hypothetical protein